MRAVGRHGRIVGQLRAVVLGELELRRRGDPHLEPRERAEDGERAGDVVAVADVGEHLVLEVAERLAQRHQVGERLQRVVLRREHVDHGHGRVGGELVEALLAARAQADRGRVAREHERGVAHGLAARELQLVRAQHHRVAAHLDDARLHRGARARRGVLEQQRDGPVLEHARGGRLGLQLERAVEQAVQLLGGELLAGEQVARQVRTVLSGDAVTPPDRPAAARARRRLRREEGEQGLRQRGRPATDAAPPRRRHGEGGDEGHPLRAREGHRARRADRALDQRATTSPHTVKAETGADFESKAISKGKTFDAKLTKAGTIDYVCTIHPSQNGPITVTQ